MHKPFDQFHKALLTVLLDGQGRVDAELEVPSQVQRIDATFEPDVRAGRNPVLGWLGRMAAAGACLFECYSTPPSIQDTYACMRKQLVLHQTRQLTATRKRQVGMPMPRLWILTAGRPAVVLRTYQSQPMRDWPAGFWHLRSPDPVHLVIVRELPETPETLLLRLFGRGPTLAQAVGELETLPPDNFARQAALPLALAFRRWISQNDHEEQDMKAYQQLMAIADEIRQDMQEVQEAQEKGLRQARQEGLVEGERELLTRLLTRRFGPLPGDATARIRHADRTTLERWTDRILTAPSLDDVLA